jgi:hypothetical protein
MLDVERTMSPSDFRTLALAIPDAVESAHCNHPDFRLGGKVFASLGAPDEDWAMVKLTPEQQADFLERAPDALQPCSGAWGRSGCTNIHLASAQKTLVRQALEAAAANLASKAKQKRRTAS